MWPLEQDKEQVLENIRLDFTAFSIYPSVKVEQEGNGFGVTWEAMTGPKRARIFLSEPLKVKPEGSDKVFTYREFLASELMADLLFLANMICRTMNRPQDYINLKAELTEDDEEKINDSTILIKDVLLDKPFDATNLLFVRAPAGSGKTVTMKKMTVDRAEEYRSGKLSSEDWLFIYVDAQGKALANLDNVLAQCLDDLGQKLNYRAVAALTRNNLLVPIIDGFDELIGSGGYADAFGSLSTFLATLERDGALIATGRSTFYDMHVLHAMAQRYEAGNSLSYKIRSIVFKEWNDEQILSYFEKRLDGRLLEEAKQILEGKSSQDNLSPLSKPFYSASVVDLIQSGAKIEPNKNLLFQIVHTYLDRETSKFLNRQGEKILGRSGHEKIMMEVAEEMWWSERREIDRETLQEHAALVADELKVPAQDIEILRSKMDSYALLKLEPSKGFVKWFKFEHDVYYEYFLLKELFNFLNEPSQLKAFLSRSLLGESLLEEFSANVKDIEIEKLTEYISNLVAVAKTGRMDSQLSRNSGSLLMAMINERKDIHQQMELRNLDMSKGRINNAVIDSWKFINCRLNEVDLRGTHIKNSIFDNTNFDNCYVDENSTRFDGSRLGPRQEVFSLMVERKGLIYDPMELTLLLKKMGATVPDLEKEVKLTEDQKELIKLLGLFERRVRGRYFFDLKNDNEFDKIKHNKLWQTLYRYLKDCNIIEDRKKGRSGPESYIQHLMVPAEKLLEGENFERTDLPEAVRGLWDRILGNA